MKFCKTLHVLEFARFNPTVCALPPVYDPENVSVPLVAVRVASVPPSETPLMVELASIPLVIAPVPMVNAPLLFERPAPRSELNDEPLTTRLVVEAVANDAYAVEDA